MPTAPRRHRSLRSAGAIALTLLFILGPSASVTSAAGAPILGDAWSSAVEARSGRLHAEVNPNGLSTSAYFEYVTKAAFDSTGFSGAKRVSLNLGSGTSQLTVTFPVISGLTVATEYRYRLTATNSGGASVGPVQFFITQSLGGGPLLPDNRGWEMVSPVDKNGGQVDPPGAIAKGGTLQAGSGGGIVTYSSAASFAGGQGAPPASQYIATRTASGWTTQNITVPIFSGSYDTVNGGAPYRLFSADLARGLLLNGKLCRGEATTGCPVANPTLAGTDAPAGFQNYYLRDTASGGFEALLGPTEVTGLDPADFAVSLAGASADLRAVVLSSCARLTAAAVDGCLTDKENLYRWSGGSLTLLNTIPGAELAAPSGAVSTNGSRIYWRDTVSGNLFQGLGVGARQADAGAGGGGSFQTATPDGGIAYFTKAGDLWRYSALADSAGRLTSSGDVEGVLGASQTGSHLYYLRSGGLYLCAAAQSAGANGCDAATEVADDADATNYPPATGTSRVSADGTKLLFLSTTPLETYDANTFDNTDLNTRAPDSQVYLYDSLADRLTCVSCNPTNGRPIGPSSIPGAIENGSGLEATIAYKPRVLSANGRRVFFDSSDALALTDTNSGAPDAYQWEAQGEGSCTKPTGCVSLISSGRSSGGALFIDASADGSDAFFTTDDSLITDTTGNDIDPGAVDLYDARIGGGFPIPSPPIPCQGDACQVLPPQPVDPTLTTLLSGPGNPSARYRRYGVRAAKRCPKGKKPKTIRKKGKTIQKCVKERKRRGGRR